MKQLSITALIILYSAFAGLSQTYNITGTIADGETGMPLPGVNVLFAESQGVASDFDGKYTLELKPGTYTLTYSFVGYNDVTHKATINNEDIVIHTKLFAEVENIDIVTVSGDKYERKFGSESVSIDVLPQHFIENTNNITLDDALEKVPGVTMISETINIRGGAGYSGGASSRVMVLLDGIPLLTADDNDIEFGSLPLENVKQVEIIKGAASTLYGSSALNGIINVITENPSNKPFTKFQTFYSVYENPFPKEKKELYFADGPQMAGGFSFVHRRKIKRLDLVVSGGGNMDETHLYNNTKKRVRLYTKLRFRPKINDRLTLGLNFLASYKWGGFFFLWKDYGSIEGRELELLLNEKLASQVNQDCQCLDSLAYIPNEILDERVLPISIDPYLTYFDKKNNMHSIKGRWYYTDTRNMNGQDTKAGLYYGEYTLHSKWAALGLNFITGVNASYSNIKSAIFEDRVSKNGAIFFNLEKKFFNKFSITGGARVELFKLDSADVAIRPIGRLGVNLQLAEASFLRASIGQGFRFPSIAEKFVKAQRSGQYVVPNINLEPEHSWSSEIGFKQGFKISSWKGYLDVAAFIMQYYNLIEFTAAPDSIKRIYWPDVNTPAFWSKNITNARISGFEVSAIGQGKIFGFPLNFLLGYTYIYPIELDVTVEKERQTIDINDSTQTTIIVPVNAYHKILNYRFQHVIKADIETSYKGITFGITGYLTSFMVNVDPLIVSLIGVQKFREDNHGAEVVIDTRLAYTFKTKNNRETAKIALIGKNLFNNQYTSRPGLIEPPRNYTLQVSYWF